MKKILSFMLIGMLMLGATAHAAAPSWLSEEAIAVLKNVPGFTYEYDEMYDRMFVSPTDVLAAYQSGDGVLNPRIEGFGQDKLMFVMVFTSERKYNESITGIIILVDGMRYIYEIPAEQQSGTFTFIPVGETAADMVRAITASTNPIKVRCEYKSGNVDFEMTAFQIEALDDLFTAFEAIGGTKIPVFSTLELLQPVTVR